MIVQLKKNIYKMYHTKMNNLTQGSLGQAASSEDFSAEKSSDEAACPSEPWVKLFIFV